jgi:hypothetical protein
MSRTPLVIGAIVLLAAGVGLFVSLSGDDDAASKPATPIGDGVQKPVVAPPSGEGASVTVTNAPSAGHAEPAEPGSKPSRQTLDGVPVRDHRSGDQPPVDLPPNIHPAEGRMLPVPLTSAISGQVRKVMADCLAGVSRDGRGTKPRLEGQIDVAIKKGTMSVTKSIMQVRDFENPGIDAVKQCVESKSVGLSAAAASEADLDSYSIRMSYEIP